MIMPRNGLYAITDCVGKKHEAVVEEVAAVIRGGAVMIQYRDKSPSDKTALAQALAACCRRLGVPFIVNDDVELAAASQADGVHLGRDDGDIAAARQRLGAQAIIGMSCYDSLDRALHAEREGADYVAFGRFFPSQSKPLARPAHLATLTQARQSVSVPIVAIGGILPGNGAQLLHAGANLLAVIGGVFNDNPETSALAFQPLFATRS
jgi:thiamine-phosphate pyrophosphorylase